MGKKGRPAKGAKGMKLGKFGKAAKRALLGMSKQEREMVVAGLSKGNTSNWSAKKMREGMEPRGKQKAELAAAAPANQQTARAYFCKPNQVGVPAALNGGGLPAVRRTSQSPDAPLMWAFECSRQRILLVGEGNFSFALALLDLLGGDGERLTCTAYDSMAVIQEKYKDAASNIKKLSNAGATVHLQVGFADCLYLPCAKEERFSAMNGSGGVGATSCCRRVQVDATELENTPALDKNYDMVIFNFPHVGLGIKEQNDNIEVNQALVKAYLLSAVEVVHAQVD